jgi:hypothetical protein
MPAEAERPSGRTSLAIVRVTVIDCSGAPASPDSTVLIAGDSIAAVGPFVDGPKEGVTNRLTVTTADQARRAVHELKASGVDFV